MSNLFDEFQFEGPEYLDVSVCETDDQRVLRECYSLLAYRNEIELAMFDPREPNAFRAVKVRTREEERELADPKFTFLQQQQMLNAAHLMLPDDDDDVNYITRRVYKSGKRLAIYTVTRSDGQMIPVYYDTDTDGKTIASMYLMSFEKAQETALHYRDIDEYRSKVRDRLGKRIAQSVLSQFDVTELKWFSDAYDDLQKIPTIGKKIA